MHSYLTQSTVIRHILRHLHLPELPQAGAEPGLEEDSPGFAATVEEPRKERTPRLDWAGLLRRFTEEAWRAGAGQ